MDAENAFGVGLSYYVQSEEAIETVLDDFKDIGSVQVVVAMIIWLQAILRKFYPASALQSV